MQSRLDPVDRPTTVHGIVLAAGAGRRYGGPKALVTDDRGPWLARSVAALRAGGCATVTVVLGAAPEAAALVPDVRLVIAEDWAEGMGASLRRALADVPAEAATVVVTLVDLPDVGGDVVRRLLDRAAGAAALARASYDGAPGHPVLIGRDHVAGVIAAATGDRGARDYLAAHEHRLVECGDLATGRDVDVPIR